MSSVPPSHTPLPADIGVLVPVEVHSDDLDSMGMLHNSRYLLLVERAAAKFWHAQGLGGGHGRLEGDSFGVVKTFTITYDTPVRAFGTYAVNLWSERLGTTSITSGYRVCSSDGATTYAHGTRTVIRLDPATLQPTPWSDRAREVALEVMAPQED